MTIRIMLGRAGSGKSEQCLNEIRQELLDAPEGSPLILLVPEQATFQAEHALVSTPGIGGMIRAQVLSFHRLAWRIMQEEGGTARLPIDDTGKKLLLYGILHRRKEELHIFHSSAEQMGFVDRLHDLLTEFKRYCLTADRLDEHAAQRLQTASGTVKDKLHDLRLVYRDFEQALFQQYLDGEDYLTLLAEQIPKSDYLKEAAMWIDGFHGFTPQEFAVLEQLLIHCRNVSITLCLDRKLQLGDEPDELDLFHPPARTLLHIRELVHRSGVQEVETLLLNPASSPRYADSPVLGHLERSFDYRIGSSTHRYSPDKDSSRSIEDQIVIKEAVNRRAEVEGAVRDMLRLVREQGVRWREIAMMVRNMEGYGDLLRTVLTDHDIPHFFDQKRTVLHHPLVEFIRSALEIVQHNWHYDAVFRCVKTDLLLPLPHEVGVPISELRANMDQLENYVLAYGIKGRRWTDSKPWMFKPRTSLEADDKDAPEALTKTLSQINEYRQRVVGPLQPFAVRLKKAKTVEQQVQALYTLLVDVQAPEKLEAWSVAALEEGKPEQAREHGQMWNSIIDMLDQLVETMGAEQLAVELFAGLIDTGLESMKLGLVPPSIDQVLIGSMDRTRSSGIQYAYILGVNDGVIPAQIQENGVLTERERDELQVSGLQFADGSQRKLLDEAFLVYTSLAVPSKRLWLSYPLADEEGKALLPSELIKQVRNLIPQAEVAMLLAEPAPVMPEKEQADYIAHPALALSHLAVRMKHWMLGGTMAECWWEAYNWFAEREQWRPKQQALVQALLYTNKESPLSKATSQLLYGHHLRASVSRMERFAACPFSHFMSHGLRLQERRVYRLEAPDIGQLFHAALKLFAEGLREEQVEWGSLSAEQCMERSAAVVDVLAPRLQGEILLSSSRYHYMAKKLKQVVGRAATVLGEHARKGQFTPIGLEIDFGPGKKLPPLTFKLDNGCTMEIIGRIDRVDSAEGADGILLRVIDYKSSSTSLQLSEIYYGLSLQMLTYFDVILTHAEQWLGIEAKPAGVLYFHVHNPMLQAKNALAPAEAEKELRKRFKMKGLVTADPEIAGLMDDQLTQSAGHSSLIPVALKKDGSFYSSSSVATPEQWELLRTYVRTQIKRIGTDITEGHVAIAPYRMGLKSACQHCSYKAVCQFDPLFEGNEPQIWKTRGKEHVWTELEALVK